MKKLNLILMLVVVFIIFSCSAERSNPNDPLSSNHVPVTGINLNKLTTTIDIGSTDQLMATIEPANATNKYVSWSTSDSGRAIVSASGLVTAVGLYGGSTIITVITQEGGFTATCSVTTNHAPVYSADGVSFDMAYVPGGITFPTGIDDGSTATVMSAYWIGETEVTYELWSTVYTWATANGYYFANAGWVEANGQYPVRSINWRDSLVWCNAATEWYNARNSTNYTCVYRDPNGPIIRDSRDSNATVCDNAVAGSPSTGFRLLTGDEWELAARWRNESTNTVSDYINPFFTKGDSASGASANCTDAVATQEVAWYFDNSGGTSHFVKTKTANTLGIYDMTGNVNEWCFDLLPSSINRMHRSGSYDAHSDIIGSVLPIASVDSHPPILVDPGTGLRFARTQLE